MSPLRPAAALLVLLMLVSGFSYGAARGQARAAGELVICAGGAAVTVRVDAEGQPVRDTHLCPDGIQGALSALLPPGALPAPRPAGLRPGPQRAGATVPPGFRHPAVPPRGPPARLL
ncbi:hypothetical protein [Poseidonocella sp. HB161398]|uniref:hypothetical protein n=1 Tax=Poseidonocella sp. HB161398 TaxID=2320855 RepID=UPI001108E5A1|nr:hypothetical protein [Poseidonocella sp. HB161398]